MRIIAGTKRGKQLFTPKDEHIRPTADRAREAVYSILTAKLEKPLNEYDFMDIFSGTGAFGLEAASRGAKSVTFVDIDLKLTQKNAELCGFSNLSFIKSDARKLPRAKAPVDIIFADAPYNLGLSEPTLVNLIEKGYISAQTLVIIETAKDEHLEAPKELDLIDERVYGAAKFSFFILK